MNTTTVNILCGAANCVMRDESAIYTRRYMVYSSRYVIRFYAGANTRMRLTLGERLGEHGKCVTRKAALAEVETLAVTRALRSAFDFANTPHVAVFATARKCVHSIHIVYVFTLLLY